MTRLVVLNTLMNSKLCRSADVGSHLTNIESYFISLCNRVSEQGVSESWDTLIFLV